jgi:enoyl-CoA hydratase
MAEDPDLHWKALLRHYDVRKPLIAAVEGWAVAGGTEILQATDIRVAGESAVFGVFEAKRGLFPLGGSTVRLRRQIPYTVAMETAPDRPRGAGGGGPAHRPHRPRGPRRHRAGQGAGDRRRDRANGPLAVEAIKRRCARPRACPRWTAWPGSSSSGWPVFASNDAAEGQKAFAEKRPPNFTRT